MTSIPRLYALGLLACLACLMPVQVLALDRPWTFSLYFENDIFNDTDQNYTNGVRLTWISPDLSAYRDSDKLPGWSLPLIRRLPFINEPGLQRNIALSLGQSMYTPQDLSRTDLIRDDRPYAGWLYAAVAFHSKSLRRLDSMEIQVGMAGPASLAEPIQKRVHKWKDSPYPHGWDNQIKNEPGLVVVHERTWRSFQADLGSGMGFDFLPHVGGALGNVAAYLNAGMEFRLGLRLPSDFGTCPIRPGCETNAPLDKGHASHAAARDFGIHLFASVDGRAVVRDITLDGNTFTDSHSVDRRPFMGEAAAGMSLVAGRFKISYTQVFQTKTFYGQKDSHAFGSVSVSFTY
ncbi:MAG: lipid A deacylase LpxR family protein [Deltaproteobacteria bacterium]|nr:lipid A deacylase LpxR family protein [Deltaproteobacteria bacterium]